MEHPIALRKKPVEVQAIQWIGSNHDAVEAFAPGKVLFDVPERNGITAEVWDVLHSTWVGVKTGQWIVRGVAGEFYPVAEDVLAATYEIVEA